MKKVLMGTTAMVAAGLLAAGPALAEGPVSVGVKGYAEHWVAYVNQDEVGSGDYSGFDTKSNVEVHFKGSAELDNGLTVGVNVQLEGTQGYSANGEVIDESFVTISGSFGRFDIGGLDSVMSRMKTGPADVGRLYADDGYVGWFAKGDYGSPGASHMRFGQDHEQITYMTPRMSGLQVGVSYLPTLSGPGGQGQPDRNAETTDVISGAVNYKHALDNGSATVAATYGSGDDAGAGMNVSAYVAVSGVGVGVSWGQTDDKPGGDLTAYAVGADYTAGPMKTGIIFFHGENEGSSAARDIVHASAAWVLGPGVDATFTVGHTTYSMDGMDDIEATYGVGGFRVVF